MRCNICNVDVSENTKKCPLCGAATVEEEPVLKGIETAYYPKVKYKKVAPPYNFISILVWFAASLITFIIDLTVNNGDITYTLMVATTIPCLWAFLVRPMYTKYYYFGRFIISDVIFLSLWLTVMSAGIFTSVLPAVSYIIPGVLVVAMLVFLFSSIFVRKNLFRAPPYVILLGVIALLMGVISFFINGAKFYIYSIPLALALFIVVVLWVISPNMVKEELKARFHS